MLRMARLDNGSYSLLFNKNKFSSSGIARKVAGSVGVDNFVAFLCELIESADKEVLTEPADLIRANQEKIKQLEFEQSRKKEEERRKKTAEEEKLRLIQEEEKKLQEKRNSRKLSLEKEPQRYTLNSWRRSYRTSFQTPGWRNSEH